MELTEIFDEVDDAEETYRKVQYLRFVGMLFLAFLFNDLITNALTGYSYLFASTKDLKVLEEKIISADFIPKDYDVNDITCDEIFLTSWDINGRTPRFFTKWS